MYFNFALNLYMTVSSADHPDQAQHSVRSENVWPARGLNCLTL